MARACDMDYVEQPSLNRRDTRALCLWAWTYNPSDIPKVTWLTLSSRRVEFHDREAPPPGCGHHGLTFKVLIHLDRVENPPGRDGRVMSRGYTWRYGVIDGDKVPCDYHDQPPRNSTNTRRNDNDNRRGRHRCKGDNWSSLLFHSLSQAPKDRECERSEMRHDHRRDRNSVHGNHHEHLGDNNFNQTAINSGDRTTTQTSSRPNPRNRATPITNNKGPAVISPPKPAPSQGAMGRNTSHSPVRASDGRGRSQERSMHHYRKKGMLLPNGGAGTSGLAHPTRALQISQPGRWP